MTRILFFKDEYICHIVGHIVYAHILDIESNESACIFFILFHSFKYIPELGQLDHLIILVLVLQGSCMQFPITSVLSCVLTVLKLCRYNVPVPAGSESETLPFGLQMTAVLLAFPCCEASMQRGQVPSVS